MTTKSESKISFYVRIFIPSSLEEHKRGKASEGRGLANKRRGFEGSKGKDIS